MIGLSRSPKDTSQTMMQDPLQPFQQSTLACPSPQNVILPSLPPLLLVPAAPFPTSTLAHTCPVQWTTIFCIYSIFIGTMLQTVTKGISMEHGVNTVISHPVVSVV